MRATRRHFVVLTDDYAPRVDHVEAAPEDPADYAARCERFADEIMGEPGFTFHEVDAATEEAAGQAALLQVVQRRAAQDAQAYAYDRADEDDEQAAPEPDRRPGAGQLALCEAGPQQPRRNITQMAHTQDLIHTP